MVALGAAILAGGRASYEFLVKFSRDDPFKALRARTVPGLSDQVGIQMRNVLMRHYSGPKLTLAARLGAITVSKDRMSFDLEQVSDGVYHDARGTTRFSADRGNWNEGLRILTVNQNARIQNRDLNLRTSMLTFDQRSHTVRVPVPIKGVVKDGQTVVDNLTYNMETGAFKAGRSEWTGRLAMLQEAAPQADERTPWHVIAASVVSAGKKTNLVTYENGSATDGDVLVKGPHLEQNTKTDVLTATGRVFYYSAKADLIADKVVVYHREKRAVLTGNVIMLVKPKSAEVDYQPHEEPIPPFKPLDPNQVTYQAHPTMTHGPTQAEKDLDTKLRSGDTARDVPCLVTATHIEYWYAKGDRHAKIDGAPQARQEFPEGRWRHIWTNHAFYDGEKETLLLESSPDKKDTRMKNSIGDDMLAKSFLVSTKEDDDAYSGSDMDGIYNAESDEVPDTKKNPPSKGSTVATAGPGQKPPEKSHP